jgi:glutaredoxin
MLELYVKKGCPHCRKQIEQLDQGGLVYKLYDVGRDSSALKEAKEKYGANIVPVLVENGEAKSIGFQGKG